MITWLQIPWLSQAYKQNYDHGDPVVSGQRLEWTKVRTGENTHGASNFNEIKNQCEHPIEGSDQ